MFVKKLISLSLFLCAASACCAQDSLLLRDFQFVKQRNPWLTAPCAAGLTQYAAPNIAEAEAGISYADGGLTDYWQPPKALQATVHAEAFQRLSARTVVYGAISYDNLSGRNMAGSAFIDPTRKPFDIVEDSLTNTGRKHRDTYLLTGAIGVELWKGYSLGARVGYTAANYAKYKDLRHSNKLMDLQLSVGATGEVTPWLTVGANYLYHRNTESITFSTYGKEDRVYKSLISYGAFMGRVEQFGTTGYTESGRELPLVEDRHGGSVQVEWKPTAQWAFYNCFTLSHGTGYYGRKSPYTVTFTNHKRDLFSYQGTLQYRAANSEHRLNMAVSREKLVNNVETYRELTNANGAHYYQYYDPVKAGDKKWTNISVSYTADLMVNGELPTWTLTAGIDWRQRDVTGIVYPYYRTQKLNTTLVYASGTRHIVLTGSVLSLTAHLSYQGGSGTPYEDRLYQTPSSQDRTPPTMEAWLFREYRLLTAKQYGMGANVKYAFVLPKTRLTAFVKGGADYAFTNTSNEYTDGNRRLRLSMAVGCTF
ncbi:MAG: hypothetical protein IJV38_01530 [Prevotella sp.]|nr:hypothetical protein [Prevotella sp.]